MLCALQKYLKVKLYNILINTNVAKVTKVFFFLNTYFYNVKK